MLVNVSFEDCSPGSQHGGMPILIALDRLMWTRYVRAQPYGEYDKFGRTARRAGTAASDPQNIFLTEQGSEHCRQHTCLK